MRMRTGVDVKKDNTEECQIWGGSGDLVNAPGDIISPCIRSPKKLCEVKNGWIKRFICKHLDWMAALIFYSSLNIWTDLLRPSISQLMQKRRIASLLDRSHFIESKSRWIGNSWCNSQIQSLPETRGSSATDFLMKYWFCPQTRKLARLRPREQCLNQAGWWQWREKTVCGCAAQTSYTIHNKLMKHKRADHAL